MLFFNATLTYATPDDSVDKLIQYLAQEKVFLSIAANDVKAVLNEPIDPQKFLLLQQQNKERRALIEAKIESLNTFLINQKKYQDQLSHHLKKLKQTPPGKTPGMITQEQIIKVSTLSEVNLHAIELIQDTIMLAKRYQSELMEEERHFDVWHAKMEEQLRLEELSKRVFLLEKTRVQLFDKNVALQQEREKSLSFDQHVNIDAKLLLNDQAIILIQYRMNALEIEKKLLHADYMMISHQDVKTLQIVTDVFQNAVDQLGAMEQSLEKMIILLKKQQIIHLDNTLRARFISTQKMAVVRLNEIHVERQKLIIALVDKQQKLKLQLSVRQSLAEYHLESWPSILNQLVLIPAKFYGYLKSLGLKVVENYAWLDLLPQALYWASLGFILMLAYVLHGLLRFVIQDKERQRLSAHLYDGMLSLVYRNIPLLTLLASVIVSSFLNHIPYANCSLLVNLLLVWLIFRSLIIVARLFLLESVTDSSGQDVKLYYRVRWLLLFGGWATALMEFSHQLPLPLLIQDIFNRIFMLFLLAVSWVGWRSKDVIPYLLRPVLKTKRRYFRHAITLVTFLVPLILLTTALIGLVGYINLAWTLSQYQAYVVLLITSYVLARGLAFDALELLSEWMISCLRNGWLWIEVLLKPLDKILRLLLLSTGLLVLFHLFGWYQDTLVMDSLHHISHYPLVDVSGIHITLISVIEFVILLFMFTWASKWTREFCYRWLFRNSRDAGIRNSLSVFTQYAVILLGVFITLRVLGLDFSGMSMIIGGLAVGMGFGLRDFASNIVGGLMLLIERPVREGDLITLGEYEGRVAHIGIRSMRVSSWDNMEVLIPNAETFNKPFTNWTHQDSIVRTVVPIKVSRADDPVVVQQLILDVLAIIPEILSDPTPQVFLESIDDALIHFEVRYFINVQLYTRFEIRSKVLFAIMAQFKAAGVKPPVPPFSVELACEEKNYLISKQYAED